MKPNPLQDDRLARAVELSHARGPSPEALARMQASLLAAGVVAPAAPAGSSGLASAARLGRASLARWAGGMLVAGAAVVAGAWIHHRAASSAATTGVETAPTHQAPPLQPPPAAATQADVIPSISVDELPRSPRPVKEARPAPKSVAAPPAPAPATADTELALVQKAQAALGSDPASALALAERHASEFPSGELSQERELIAIEALAKLGQSDQADARATRFLADHPRTPYRLRIERALGHAP